MYRGIFWIKDLDNLENNKDYLIKIETNTKGDPLSYPFPLNSKKNNNYVHQRTWPLLPYNLTRNKPFDYWPRGRVEIKDGKLTIFINPNLNREDVLNYIYKEFDVLNQGLDGPRVVLDTYEHYKCHLDR